MYNVHVWSTCKFANIVGMGGTSGTENNGGGGERNMSNGCEAQRHRRDVCPTVPWTVEM